VGDCGDEDCDDEDCAGEDCAGGKVAGAVAEEDFAAGATDADVGLDVGVDTDNGADDGADDDLFTVVVRDDTGRLNCDRERELPSPLASGGTKDRAGDW
jgi:hypothetical protein